jgi:menaquinone-specific isochorismate synthase
MTDFALFRLPGEEAAWLGWGPFQTAELCPDSGGAFYVNDFTLADPHPWKIPQRLEKITLAELETQLPALKEAPPVVAWSKPTTEWFKMVFRRIRREILAQRLEKMVPVLTEHGLLKSGQILRLLRPILNPPAPTSSWGYAWVQSCMPSATDSSTATSLTRGFLGASPELLFHACGSAVSTMALAGTAKPSSSEETFRQDIKEIAEHEIVVRFLEKVLQELPAQVSRGPRGLCQAARSLLHFQTHLQAQLPGLADPDQLVQALHPTPAVGCLPSEPLWLEKLHHYRAQLRAPSFFGAPFGFAEPAASAETRQSHFIVSIRGLSWSGQQLQLPSGCGVVAGSAFDHEWRELQLKREAVLKSLEHMA